MATDRTEQVNSRLTKKERRKLERAAERAGLPFSEWLRVAALAAADSCPLCGSELHRKAKVG